MKAISKYFQKRQRYSSVNASDDDPSLKHQHQITHTTTGAPVTANVAAASPPNATANDIVIASAEKQRKKSLKANRSMNPANILSSFFNERGSSGGARSPKCAFVVLTLGILALIVAILVKIMHPYLMIFKYKLVLEDGGEIFNLWAEPPVDLYLKVYLFNITNAAAFMAGRERINVQQVGPYTYREMMTHKNIVFNENNTISTNPSHPLVWQEHLSEGNREDDEVVMLNIAMLAISHVTAEKSYFHRMGLNTLFITSNSSPLVRMTAKEFMFGYQSSLTTLGNTFLPSWISFEKVGLIDRMYDFDTDFETFYAGIPDPSISGLYATYRGSPNLPHWTGEHCSNIDLASDGTKFKSFIQPNESLKFFRKSMCRPMRLYREGEVETYGSLSGYKYVFEENALDNGATVEDNKCFCRKGYCQPSGLIDVTDCYYGFPISLSYPHFLNGDPGLQTNVTGLTPNKDKHSSAFVVQPQSGLPLSISAKIQINMHFNDLSTIRKVHQFSHLTVPMLWFEIMMPELPPALDARFDFYLNILPYLDVVGFWSSLLLGVVLLGFAVTRATLHLSNFPPTANLSTTGHGAGLLYAKANLFANSSVYKPCEMKLLNSIEKHSHHQVFIGRESGDDTDVMTDSVYTEMPSKTERMHSYVLEMEPAISSDEDNESDANTESPHSTVSCDCTEDEQDDNDNIIGNVNDDNDICTNNFDAGRISEEGKEEEEKCKTSKTLASNEPKTSSAFSSLSLSSVSDTNKTITTSSKRSVNQRWSTCASKTTPSAAVTI